MVETLQPVQPVLTIESTTTRFNIEIRINEATQKSGQSVYYVGVANSIERILRTRLGSRLMRPTFGSALYLLRDRDFNAYWRAMATRYMFEAISQWEPRVRFKQLHFNVDLTTGQYGFYLALEPVT